MTALSRSVGLAGCCIGLRLAQFGLSLATFGRVSPDTGLALAAE